MRRLLWLLLGVLVVVGAGAAGWDVNYAGSVRALHDRLMQEVDAETALQKLFAMQIAEAFATPDRDGAMDALHRLRPPAWKRSAHAQLEEALREWQDTEPTIVPARLGQSPDEVMQTSVVPWVEETMASPRAAEIQALVRSMPAIFGETVDIRQNLLDNGRKRVDAAFAAWPNYQASRAACEQAFTRATKVFGLF